MGDRDGSLSDRCGELESSAEELIRGGSAFSEHQRRGRLQLLDQGVHRVQREVPLATLQPCVVAHGYAELLGELLLGESASESNGADLLSQRVRLWRRMG